MQIFGKKKPSSFNYYENDLKATILRNLDNFPPGAFYSTPPPLQSGTKEYARSYKLEIIDSKDPLAQLEASKSTFEMKGFKYQIIVKVLLCKCKGNGDNDFAPLYFNSATKTVINSDIYGLDRSF